MPAQPVEFHPTAIEEARAAREWYDARSSDAASAFVAELDVALGEISEAPQSWPSMSAAQGTFYCADSHSP